MKKTVCLIVCLVIAVCTLSFAQTEYLVKLNIATGAFQKIKKIDSVQWILDGLPVLESNHDKYIFVGAYNSSGPYSIYTLDIKTGNVLSKAPYPYATTATTVTNMLYNPYNDSIYCVHIDHTNAKGYIATIDPTTGIYTDRTQIPALKDIFFEGARLDVAGNKYYFPGFDLSGGQHFYTFDINTGNLSTPPFPVGLKYGDSYAGFQYDGNLNRAFTIYEKHVNQADFLADINPSTGSITILDSLHGVTKANGPNKQSVDEIHHYFTFFGNDSIGNYRMLTISTLTGAVIYDAPVPQPKTGDNMIYFRHHDSTDITYALFWEAVTVPDTSNPDTTTAVRAISENKEKSCLLIPNVFTPGNEQFNIRSTCSLANFKMQVYSLAGQRLYETDNIRNSWDGTCNNSPVSAGTYYYTIEMRTTAGKTGRYKGRITLLR